MVKILFYHKKRLWQENVLTRTSQSAQHTNKQIVFTNAEDTFVVKVLFLLK